MAIGTDDAIEKFGTQDEATTGTPSAVADGSFSGSGDVSTWTNDDDAPRAVVLLNATFGTAPDADGFVNLYARLMNVQSTNDQDEPSGTFEHLWLGSFPTDEVTSAQWIAIEVDLPNVASSQEYDFYIENQAGQQISSGWALYITPKTLGPHA